MWKAAHGRERVAAAACPRKFQNGGMPHAFGVIEVAHQELIFPEILFE
jgi:hypothetical protein